ncbi:MAG: ATP-binding protein [Armatimonadota bacterium]
MDNNRRNESSDAAENPAELHYTFYLNGGDFSNAGAISTRIKKILQQIGAKSETIRRAAIATYEAEMNIVIHASSGEVTLNASAIRILIKCQDKGPGIPDIKLAMQPGYSTASDKVREMGFGAGMGLPNMQRCADSLEIQSTVGTGTTVDMVFKNE